VQNIFLLFMASRPSLGFIQLPIKSISGALSSRVKLRGREADHSSPSTAEIKNGGATSPLPHTSSWRGA
jgi:hypothetical protein